ncbi:hypothetical protein BD626DRAFT_545722 [Schizophyllum amplum]|uniref:HNH nuclease domain-containing protein n=1 Tax=Schizophyllum amplum TaxID=97359 RepID=A0A550CNY6_9AGAR|nr:hypothetical protein BD626DRAFT_545722 [Auriculariopsis ampla]
MQTFDLPLTKLPEGFGCARSSSLRSTSTTFETCLDARDRFRGERCCVICGWDIAVQHCQIIRQAEWHTWRALKARQWLPPNATHHGQHDPRNGMLMCANHRLAFENYWFYIRYSPEKRRFIFIDQSDDGYYRKYHGKAIALDVSDRYAPFATLFLIHEQRVRGHWPFAPVVPDLPQDTAWQDWIVSSGYLRDPASTDSPLFQRDWPQHDPTSSEASSFHPVSGGPATSTGLALNDDVVAQILDATRNSLSWKTSVLENTSWEGTAEENIEKYQRVMGDDNPLR